MIKSVSEFNRRLENSVSEFFEDELGELYADKGWLLPAVAKSTESVWDNGHFRVEIAEKYPDGVYKAFRYTLRVPAYVAKDEIGYEHRFYFTIPREYPDLLHRIKIINLTPLYHLRVLQGQMLVPVCYVINGEIPAILRNLIDFLLLKPDVVMPRNSDKGYDHEMTNWYLVQGPDKVHARLVSLWNDRQTRAKRTSGKKLVILKT